MSATSIACGCPSIRTATIFAKQNQKQNQNKNKHKHPFHWRVPTTSTPGIYICCMQLYQGAILLVITQAQENKNGLASAQAPGSCSDGIHHAGGIATNSSIVQADDVASLPQAQGGCHPRGRVPLFGFLPCPSPSPWMVTVQITSVASLTKSSARRSRVPHSKSRSRGKTGLQGSIRHF